MEFSRQGYWSGLPFPTPEDLPDPGIEPTSLVSPPLAGGFFTTEEIQRNYQRKSIKCNFFFEYYLSRFTLTFNFEPLIFIYT